MCLKACVHEACLAQELALVLEDDMQVLRWPTEGTLHFAPPDWEVLQLYMLGKAAQQLYADPPSLWVPWRPGIFNTGAYLISRTGMRKVRCAYDSRCCRHGRSA